MTLEQSETDGDIGDFDKTLVEVGSDAAPESSDSNGSTSQSDCSLPKPYYAFTITVFYAPGNASRRGDRAGHRLGDRRFEHRLGERGRHDSGHLDPRRELADDSS